MDHFIHQSIDNQDRSDFYKLIADLPVNSKFYFNHKCYFKDHAGNIEELTYMRIKKVYEIRKDMHAYFSYKIKNVVKIGCQHNGTRYHAAEVKVNKKNRDCIKGDYPDMWFDFAQVSLTHSNDGHYLKGVPDAKVTCPDTGFTLSWDPDCPDVPGVAEKTDRMVLVLFNLNTQTFVKMCDVAEREDACVRFKASYPEFHHELVGWAFFVSKCKRYASDTCYLGKFSKNSLNSGEWNWRTAK